MQIDESCDIYFKNIYCQRLLGEMELFHLMKIQHANICQQSIPNVGGETMLAVNRQGIVFLRKNTHETFLEHPFSEILSTRRYHGDNNVNYLDMKLGNLMVQQILRIETDQVSVCDTLTGLSDSCLLKLFLYSIN